MRERASRQLSAPKCKAPSELLRQQLHKARGVKVEGAAVDVEQEVQHFVATVQIDRSQRLLIRRFEASPQAALAILCDEVIDLFEVERGSALLQRELEAA